jgi:integrase
MSVYKNPRSPFFHFDFQLRGHRFHGSTRCTTRREAEKVEAAEREKAKLLVGQIESARTSLRLDDIAGRYWAEVGQHHAGAAYTEHKLDLLIRYFGKDKLITDIVDDDVAKLVAWRRGHWRFPSGTARTNGSKSQPATLISPFTVNHTTRQLRKLFTRAKMWGVRFAQEPTWTRHLLPESLERVRELSDAEADRLYAVMRDDYAPFFAFARATGLRLAECLLRWDEVKWEARQIRKPGKGGRYVTTWITSEVREILWPLRGHHPEFVFTYLPQRAGLEATSKRRPITYAGVQMAWRRLRKRAGLVGFRFHDFRHDFASKVLRTTGNLKLTQKALNHRDIKTTLRYAHVLDSEVAEALERVAESRTKPRSKLKAV